MVLNPNFFLPGTDHSLKVQSRMEGKVRIKNLKSLLAFFEKFVRGMRSAKKLLVLLYTSTAAAAIILQIGSK